MSPFSKKIATMCRREDGSVAMMAGLLLTVLVPVVIAAVDLTNIDRTKQSLQADLDSAVLSTARLDEPEKSSDSGRMQKAGERFMENALQGTSINPKDMESVFAFDANDNVIRGTASFEIPSLFVGKVFDLGRIELVSEAVPRQPVELEVALSLDVSGSMGWYIDSDAPAPVGQRRIDALRDGVDSLLNVFDAEPLVEARLSVIPYSTSVNISATTEGSAGSGDDGGSGTDGDAVEKIIENVVDGTDPDASAPVESDWATERVERNGAGKLKVSKKNPKKGQKIKTNKVGLPKASVLPLSESETIRAYVGSVEPEGMTAGHLGAEWALYSLLPEWQEVWAHDEPPATMNSDARKVVVILTDGEFTVTHTPGMTIDDAYDTFQDVCAIARNSDIAVYTVGLQASAKTDRELTECAGSEDNYYSVTNRSEIVSAFEQIAEDATRLRISR